MYFRKKSLGSAGSELGRVGLPETQDFFRPKLPC